MRTETSINEIIEVDHTYDKLKTFTINEASETATSKVAKKGNGYAKITYLDEANSLCTTGQEYIFDYTCLLYTSPSPRD